MIFLIQHHAAGQTINDLSDVRTDELTEDQIRKFINESDRLKLTDEQIEQFALQRGMNPVEMVKFKDKIQAVRKVINSGYYQSLRQQVKPVIQNRLEDSIRSLEQKPLTDFTTAFAELKTKNFAYQVFNNPGLTFEPDLKIPTPANYQLAADDELLIEVSGYSEASYRLKVSPEGIIRIPVAGPVTVTGLTIEQAKRVIKQKLARTIYSDIRTGNTTVDITLGAIRSIRVSIIGEATLPGTYTLPSLASAYNALYACAGPGANGSFRDIQVIRNNETIAVIDVYDYLANGNKKNNVRLMDQDVIKINTYSVRIELKGEIKKPGLYDVAPGETLGQILKLAGGFTDNAYTARVQVFKNTSKDRKVTTVNEDEFDKIVPGKGDLYIVGKILNRITNRVSIKGAVYRPGDYELKEGMTLLQLIAEVDGLREDAFTGRANIHRLKKDLSPEIISLDLEKIVKGETNDIILHAEDLVNVYSKFDLKEGYYVSLEGEVSAPGIFLYEEGIRVEDLVMMAGGLKESASPKRIEISRRVKDADPTASNTQMAIIYQQDISSNLKDSSEVSRFLLEPFDEVAIRPAPGYSIQKNAVIEGEVIYTGKYSLQAKNDRISDLVKRAGGLTPQAYLKGAVLVRSRKFTKTELNNTKQGNKNLLKQNYESGSSAGTLLSDLTGTILKSSDNVGIDLQKILERPGSKYDLLLNDGDTLRIPKQLQTVMVNGEVLYPALVRYDKKFRFKDYISGAGGFSERSAKKRSYVVYGNGSVKGTSSFLFIKNYPELSPGAQIYVPVKRERERLRTGEYITVGATLVSMFVILLNVLK